MIDPDRTEPLARACHADAPNTVLDRWRSLCLTHLLSHLLGAGRDVTIIVGGRTTRSRGELHVVREEERQ